MMRIKLVDSCKVLRTVPASHSKCSERLGSCFAEETPECGDGRPFSALVSPVSNFVSYTSGRVHNSRFLFDDMEM